MLVLHMGCGGARLVTEPHALVSNPSPTDTGIALDGSEVTVPAPGKVTLIDFWATSCEPCLAMMPELEALYREKRAEGLVVIGIAADDNPGLVLEYLQERGVTYPNLLDTEGSLRGAYHVTDLPQTVLVDRRGRVRLVRVGGDKEDLEAAHEAVKYLLGENP